MRDDLVRGPNAPSVRCGARALLEDRPLLPGVLRVLPQVFASIDSPSVPFGALKSDRRNSEKYPRKTEVNQKVTPTSHLSSE